MLENKKSLLSAYKVLLDFNATPVRIQNASGIDLYTNQAYQDMVNLCAPNQLVQVRITAKKATHCHSKRPLITGQAMRSNAKLGLF